MFFLLLASASSPAAPSAYALARFISGFTVCKPSEFAALFPLFWPSSFQLLLCDELTSHVTQGHRGQLKVSGDSKPGELKGEMKNKKIKPRRVGLGAADMG